LKNTVEIESESEGTQIDVDEMSRNGGDSGDNFGHEGETAESVEATVPESSYELGQSLVTEALLDRYYAEGIRDSESHNHSRAPGSETTPQPRHDEAIVFRDFFWAGFRAPVNLFFPKY
jgi:hypothetical protein